MGNGNGLNLDAMANFQNPVEELIKDAKQRQMQNIAAVEAARLEKEREARRRHEELIEALLNSSSNITIGPNATGIQIQQNAVHSSQTMMVQDGFDYEKVATTLKEIQGYIEFPQFKNTYGVNSENVKQLIEDTLSAVQERQKPDIIKKSLKVLQDLTIGAGGSLIASGILSLLGNLPL